MNIESALNEEWVLRVGTWHKHWMITEEAVNEHRKMEDCSTGAYLYMLNF